MERPAEGEIMLYDHTRGVRMITPAPAAICCHTLEIQLVKGGLLVGSF